MCRSYISDLTVVTTVLDIIHACAFTFWYDCRFSDYPFDCRSDDYNDKYLANISSLVFYCITFYLQHIDVWKPLYTLIERFTINIMYNVL